jgi:hypothetical protein
MSFNNVKIDDIWDKNFQNYTVAAGESPSFPYGFSAGDQNIYFQSLIDPNNPLGGTKIVPASGFNFIIGPSGSLNLASKSFVTGASSVVIGGFGNLAKGIGVTVAGGCFNRACANHSSIGGGTNNTICSSSCNSTIAGGFFNTTLGDCNFIGAGAVNVTDCQFSVVVGGSCNSSKGQDSFIGGGFFNCNLGCDSMIGAGTANKICAGEGHSIIGGSNNCIVPFVDFLTNGACNSVIAGGCSNIIKFGHFSIIGAGACNCISQNVLGTLNQDFIYNSILGGFKNTICRSSFNSIIGNNNCVSCCNNYSFVIGNNSTINHSGAGIISDGRNTLKTSQGQNTLTLDFISGTYIKNRTILQSDSYVPSTYTSAGVSGQLAFDPNHFYRHNGTNWTRTALSIW